MRNHVIALSLALLGLVAPSCDPLPPGSGDGDTGTSTGHEGSTSEPADTTTDPMSTSVDGTGVESVCGNGIVEAGELCDDASASATCDVDCTDVECGDMEVNAAAGEECDGINLAGRTCESLGFGSGVLSCADGCSYDASGCFDAPAVPAAPQLSFSQVKQFDFSWPAVAGAEYYQLLESAAPGEPFLPLGANIEGEAISFTMPLYLRYQASYMLRACNVAGCAESTPVSVVGSLVEAVGYFKASNTDAGDRFGVSVALSEDGSTLAVGAFGEASNATGVGGNEADDSMLESGAVYVFVRDGMSQWSQQAYVKASNPDVEDRFGVSVALSDDGSTLAVGAHGEDSNAMGVGGNEADDSMLESGAVYVFVRDGMGQWSQQAYVKASNADADDELGCSVALSGDGDTLAAGAWGEGSIATGIDGDQADDSASGSGAVYVFVRDGMGQWSQQAYVKASNTGADDEFGNSVALSSDGATLAAGAWREGSGAIGIDGNQADDSASVSGAAYVFVRDGLGQWSQQAYVKASNTGVDDWFGWSIALSGDGDTVAVGAPAEDSSSVGINGDQGDDGLSETGAAYVFARDGMGQWSQQAYVKASNTGTEDCFGWSLHLSNDGGLFAVGAFVENSNAIGIGGNEQNDAVMWAGAVYVFARDGLDEWSQQAYVKASNTAHDYFGYSLALSGDGDTLAIGAFLEDSNAIGSGGDQADDSAYNAGAVYVY